MRVSVIIPNFNGEKLLRNNLEKVIDAIWEFDEVEIIVVDDGSEDGSCDFVRGKMLDAKGKKVHLQLIENGRNCGFSFSCNKGVKKAAGEVVVLLNNDVVCKKGFLKFLINHFENKKVFGVGCLELNGLKRGRSVARFEKGLLVHKRAINQEKGDTFWVAGGSGAFRKELFEKLDGFDEVYKPFYWEDIDLSYRALKAGYKVLFEPRSVVYHKHEQTIGKLFDKMEIEKISIRNSIIFTIKNITDAGLLVKSIFWLKVKFLKSIVKGDKSYVAGYIFAVKMLPEVFKSRKRAQKMFVKKDEEILERYKDE